MAEAAGVAREAVVTGSIELSDAILKKFDALIARREKREPLAYIVGHKEFYSLDFEVTPAVLIPRPETEFVVSAALEFVAGEGRCARARYRHRIGRDRDCDRRQRTARADHGGRYFCRRDRGGVAQRRRHRAQDRVTIRRADCFDIARRRSVLGIFDVIVSNPPYLR